jgi:uncharacterized protein (DUF488 family)
MRIYTLGYEGLGIRAYADILLSFNVGVVLDVRDHAWSMNAAFIKANFERHLAMIGIRYVHVRSAGNPPEIRKTAKSAAECMTRYREHLSHNSECIGELYSYARLAFESGRPACLTCMEHLPQNCHRSVLVDALTTEDRRIEPVHLPLDAPIESRRRGSDLPSARRLFANSFLNPTLLPSK